MPTPRTGLLAAVAAHPHLTDADLLGRFVRYRDEAAFAAVVRRHGRAVLGVCRRMLGNAADADDAFQATFLVLAKKAHRVAFRDDAAGWLFAVAVRAGREALRRRAKRAGREAVGGVPDRATQPEAGDPDAGRIVLAEVANLAEPHRAAVVLCELDGVSRADAARRLGIPEGTLSSRLAAARKQLAARLTARGVSPVLVPFAVVVPAALSAGVVAASEFPSAAVLKLTEVLMRTGGTLAAGKWLASLAAVTLVVVGLSLGEDPNPAVRRAAATEAVPADPPGRLILTFREEVRYLTPEGKELQRIDYSAAKRVHPDLVSGSIIIGTNGVTMERYLPSCGRAGPGGVVPLWSNGMRTLFPGTPPTVKAVAGNEDTDWVDAWAADGKSFITHAAETSMVWGVTGYRAFRVTAANGKREQLPFGPEYKLIDASPDGEWFLTHRHVPRPLGMPGFSAAGTEVALMTRDGKLVYEHPLQNTSTTQVTGHRLSPDGRRSVACSRLRMTDAEHWQPSMSIDARPLDGPGMATLVHFQIAKPFDAECMGVAWSPDGKQVVSCWRPVSWKDKQTWHVVVCDPDGQNLRTVATLDSKPDETLRSVDWW